MGEAKRRKQLDVNYGKIYQIRTNQEFENHLIKLYEIVSEKWYEYIEGNHFDLDEVVQKLTSSIEKQFSSYKASDQQLLATALMHLHLEAGDDYLKSLFKQKNENDAVDQVTVYELFIKCLIKVLKPWLNEEQQRESDKLLEQLQGG
jgi:hypothetical protein